MVHLLWLGDDQVPQEIFKGVRGEGTVEDLFASFKLILQIIS